MASTDCLTQWLMNLLTLTLLCQACLDHSPFQLYVLLNNSTIAGKLLPRTSNLPQSAQERMASSSELVQLPPFSEQCHSYSIEDVS